MVNVLLMVANFAEFLFCEMPHYQCGGLPRLGLLVPRGQPFRGLEPWGISWITIMFLHSGWDHILGNTVFLAICDKNDENARGPPRRATRPRGRDLRSRVRAGFRSVAALEGLPG